jgi:predicted nucleic acid-binding protein
VQRYILDCSVAVKWFVPEELSDVALGLLEQFQATSVALVVPDSFVAEIGHSLRSHVRGRKLTEQAAHDAIADVVALPLEVAETRSLAAPAMQLALAHMSTFYDALYIALAEREDVKVLTADGGMVNAFAKLNRTLHLANYAPHAAEPGAADQPSPAPDDEPSQS